MWQTQGDDVAKHCVEATDEAFSIHPSGACDDLTESQDG
jgi:hypothetical protein